jgi:4'-phosphopantetheinyl transferase
MISENMNSEKLQWRRGVPGQLISSNEVHVWRVFIDTANFQSESLLETLSADELTRAEQFQFEKDQRRFIMARGILRMILAHYVGKKPHELRFEYTSYGKPVLATTDGYDTLSFNLSHSGEIALYAVTRNRKIGIDVECIRDNFDVGQIAHRFFSAGEISSLDKIPKQKQSEVFFQYWTRKEAFIKAMGKGVSFPMEQCDVSLINGKISSPITVLGDNGENPCWYGQDLFPGHGYVAAIAIDGDDCDLSCWDYSDRTYNELLRVSDK